MTIRGDCAIPEEYLQEAADLLDQHGKQTIAAQHATALDRRFKPVGTGISRGAYQQRLVRAAEKGLCGTKPVLPGFRISQTTAVTQDGEVVREYVQQKPERGEKFELPTGFKLTKISALTDGDGRLIQKWDMAREGNEPVDVIAACKAALEGWEGAAVPTPAPTASSDLLTLLPSGDLHLGMFAWKAETDSNWDLKIAEEAIGDAVEDVVTRSPASAEAIMLGGGDLLHSDNNSNMTARSGNPLQVDGRYQKVIGVACRLRVRMIDAMLRRHGHVTVRELPGNHDEHASVAIAYFLAAWYRNEPRVTVDLDPSLFFWFRFGKVLIGATHGHTVKIAQMPSIMAHRRAADWGATTHRFVHGFHLHHSAKFATEGNGVISEIHQAPIPQDSWHFGSGFLSGRSVQTISYHSEFGEIGRSRVALIDAEKREAA